MEGSVSEPMRVLVTGGTFDKEYEETTGRLFFRHTHLPEMLRLGRCRLPVSIERLMMVDSLDMTDARRRYSAPAAARGPPHRRHARHRHDGGDGEVSWAASRRPSS